MQQSSPLCNGPLYIVLPHAACKLMHEWDIIKAYWHLSGERLLAATL